MDGTEGMRESPTCTGEALSGTGKRRSRRNAGEAVTDRSLTISRLISGGEAGADRTALDWAIRHSLPHGGFCPEGRRAHDGLIPLAYNLTELDTRSYAACSERNVIEADGTLIVTSRRGLSGSAAQTGRFCEAHKKPSIHLSMDTRNPGLVLRAFVQEHSISVLNVSGTPHSEDPDACGLVGTILDEAFCRGADTEKTSDHLVEARKRSKLSVEQVQSFFDIVSQIDRLDAELSRLLRQIEGGEGAKTWRLHHWISVASKARWEEFFEQVQEQRGEKQALSGKAKSSPR
jgi:hypothetical protein